MALRYWKWGNVPEKTQNDFHAKDATIAKRYRPEGPAFALIYRTPTQVLGSALQVLGLMALASRQAVPPFQGPACAGSSAPLPRDLVQFSALLRSIGRYSLILPWRPLRPLRENIILQSIHCK
jgi:hypothetical protein